MTRPTPPIEFGGGPGGDSGGPNVTSRWGSAPTRADSAALVRDLAAVCPTSTDSSLLAEHARDWWPLAMRWALQGEVPRLPVVVVSPRDTAEVRRVVQICARHDTPITVSAGRSGVSGAAVPLFDAVVLDITAMSGVVSVDRASGLVEVLPGTFGPDLERALVEHRLTVGHFPQSFDISTVGGWIASSGAGQFSTRYGKIDEMVAGLEVVLADGTVVRTGGAPAAAQGPDLTSLFVGSEGTLGVVTRAWLRAHDAPATRRTAAFSFPTFAAGVEAMRRAIRSAATPAVLRLYDPAESQRSHGGAGTDCTLIVLDEGEPDIVDATLRIVARCAESNGAVAAPDGRVDHWLAHRNDTSGLQALTRKGFVIDTMEVAAPWSRIDAVYDAVLAALRAVDGTRGASAHVSHSYLDGACIYFTFVGQVSSREIEPATTDEHQALYVSMWDAAQRAALHAGGNLAHHHGIGLNRGRFMREALGEAFEVLAATKRALDPLDILNPGKLGLPTRRGEVGFP